MHPSAPLHSDETSLQQQIEEEIRSDQVRQLFRSSIPATVFSLFNAFILAAVQWSKVDHTAILLWLGYALVIAIYRITVTHRNLAAFSHNEAVTPAQRRELILSISLFSLLWFTSVLFLFPRGELVHQLFLAFIIAGMTSAGSTSLGIDRTLLHIYLLPVIILLALRLLLEQTLITTAMALLAPGFLFTLLTFARSQRVRMWENVELRVTSQRDAHELRLGANAFEANEAMLITDAQCNIIRSNHAFSELTGYSAEEVRGKNPRLLKSEHHDAEFYQAMWRRVKEAGSWEGEIWNRDKKGRVFPCWTIISVVHDTDGNISNYIASYTDISELTTQHELLSITAQMEQSLSRLLQLSLGDSNLQDYLRQALLMAVQSVPWIKIKPQGAIFLHQEGSRHLDLAASHNLAEPLHELCKQVPFGHCLCGKVAESGELLFVNHIDPRHDIRFEGIQEHGHYVLPLLQGEELLGVITLYVNFGHECNDMEQEYLKRIAHIISLGITRRHSDIRMAEARTQAEQASQAKSEFLSNMSHELRTPLNAIMGFAQLLEMDSTTPAQLDQIREINRASQHLLELINEILDLAKIEAGKVELDISEFSIRAVVDDCITLVQPTAQAKEIDLINHVTDPQLSFRADQTRLKQVLLNLLSNAIKYNRDAGIVRIDIEPRDNHMLRLTISDTGRGLTAQECEQLFQPFERLGQQRNAIEGTGIGLVITRRLIELMGGRIGVESEPGVGSNFWIELPPGEGVTPVAAGTAGGVTDTPSISTLHNVACNILYIEDNPVNIKLVQKLLDKSPGITLITAMDPGTGLFLAAEHHPDLILLDINLPDMDGYEVLKRLRDTPLTATTPVIGLSANALPSDIEKAREAGFNDYITKPLQVKAFIATLQQWLPKDKG